MPRRIFSLLALLSAIGPLLTSLWASSPNVVLVMADDQGVGDVGYMGHPNLLTPHFDEASRSGFALTPSTPLRRFAHLLVPAS